MENLPQLSDSVFYHAIRFDLCKLASLVSNTKSERRAASLPGDSEEYKFWITQPRFPQDPPLTYSYCASKFYIRECYRVYYDLMMECLESGQYDLLTLCGSPGSGKSMFYLYTFHRYRYEHPSATIVTAAFHDDCSMGTCRVYEPGKDGVRCDKIPSIEGAMYLYDGPPRRGPRKGKMICFSGPVPKWIVPQRMNPRHTCLWFPPWTLDELFDVNDLCEIGLSKETISERFDLFGGCARYTLATDEGFIDTGCDHLLRQTISIFSFSHFLDCFLEEEIDDFLHLVPTIDYRFPFVHKSPPRRVCSRAIDARICNRIWKTVDKNILIERLRRDTEVQLFLTNS
jgi:hypothetical protein